MAQGAEVVGAAPGKRPPGVRGPSWQGGRQRHSHFYAAWLAGCGYFFAALQQVADSCHVALELPAGGGAGGGVGESGAIPSPARRSMRTHDPPATRPADTGAEDAFPSDGKVRELERLWLGGRRRRGRETGKHLAMLHDFNLLALGNPFKDAAEFVVELADVRSFHGLPQFTPSPRPPPGATRMA